MVVMRLITERRQKTWVGWTLRSTSRPAANGGPTYNPLYGHFFRVSPGNGRAGCGSRMRTCRVPGHLAGAQGRCGGLQVSD